MAAGVSDAYDMLESLRLSLPVAAMAAMASAAMEAVKASSYATPCSSRYKCSGFYMRQAYV